MKVIVFLVSTIILVSGGWAREISRPQEADTQDLVNQNTLETKGEVQLSHDEISGEAVSQVQLSSAAAAEKVETEVEKGNAGKEDKEEEDKLLQGETRPLSLGGAGGGPGIQTLTNTLTNLPGFQGLSSFLTQLSANGPIGISGSTVIGSNLNGGTTSVSG